MINASRRALFGATATLLAAPALAQTRTVKFTLPWLAQGSTLYPFVGKDKGFFRSRGIDLEISRGFGSVAAAQAIAGGQFEFGTVGMLPLILALARGAPLQALGTLEYNQMMGVGVLADSPITSPAMLAGKKVAGVPTSTEYPFFPAYLRGAGVDPARVEIVNVDNRVLERTLTEKQVDAMMGVGSSSLPVLVSRNVAMRWMLYSAVGLRNYGNAIATTPAVLQRDPALCQAMVDALCESIAYTLREPQESMDIFFRVLPEMALNTGGKEFVRTGLGLWQTAIIGPEAREHGLGWGDPAVLESVIDLVMQNVQAPDLKRPPLDSWYTNKFAGNVKLTPAEWDAAAARVTDYSKLIG